MKLFNFILQSNIYISVAAVCLTLATQVQLGMAPQLHPYLFIIFFATMCEYNLHRFITIVIKRQALDDGKHMWVKDNLKLFYGLVIFSITGFLVAIFFAKLEVLITLAPIALITLFYSFPVFKNNRVIFRLREIPCLKIFLIAFVWSATTIFLPIIQSGIKYDQIDVGLMLAERFIFIFAITIPFDIRDMEVDKKAGLKTIPLLVGERKALIIANACLLVFAVIALLHYQHSEMVFIIPAFILSAFSTYYFVNNRNMKKFKNYHYGILDGTMLFHGALVCICYYAVRNFSGLFH